MPCFLLYALRYVSTAEIFPTLLPWGGTGRCTDRLVLCVPGSRVSPGVSHSPRWVLRRRPRLGHSRVPGQLCTGAGSRPGHTACTCLHVLCAGSSVNWAEGASHLLLPPETFSNQVMRCVQSKELHNVYVEHVFGNSINLHLLRTYIRKVSPLLSKRFLKCRCYFLHSAITWERCMLQTSEEECVCLHAFIYTHKNKHL